MEIRACNRKKGRVIDPHRPVDRGIRRTTWTTCTTDRTTAGGCRSDGCENGGAFQRRSGSSIAGYEWHLQALEGRVVAEGYA